MPKFTDQRANVPGAYLQTTDVQRNMLQDFGGGWRPDKPLSALQPNELSNVKNLEFLPGGPVRKRGGFEAFTDTVTDLDNIEFFFAPRVFTDDGVGAAPQPIFRQACFVFNTSDGSIYFQDFGDLAEDFLVEGDGADFVDTGHSLGNAGSGSTNYFRIWPISVLTWDDKVYMTSLRYSGFSGGSGAGGTWETQATTTGSPSLPLIWDAQAGTYSRPAVHDLDGTTSGFPRARTAITHHARIFAANVHKGGSYRYPSRVYWSHIDENGSYPQTWNTNSYVEVSADDGTEITALVPFGESILIFKNDSTWSLVGTDEDTFALYPLDKKIGTEGTYSATAGRGEAYFFDTHSTTVWMYDGARFEDIGAPVARYIRENLNYNAVAKAVLQIQDNYLWFSYPKGSVATTQADENTETLAYDLKLKVWTRWDFGVVPSIQSRYSDFTVSASGTVPGDSNPYFAVSAAANDNVVMKGYMGETDPDANMVWQDKGVNYTMQFRTAWFAPDRGTEQKRLRRIEFLTAENSDQIDVTMYRDFSSTAWQTFNFDPLAHADTIVEYHLQQSVVDISSKWNWLACDVQATHANEAQINGISYRWSLRLAPRGDIGGTQYHDGGAIQ